MSLEVEAAAGGLSRGLVHELLTVAWWPPSVTTVREPPSAAAASVLGLRGFGVRLRVTDRTGLALTDQLAALVPPELIDGRRGPVHTELAAIGGVDGAIDLSAGEEAYSTGDSSTAVAWLRAMVDATIATEATEALFVHAGVVGWRGHAVLVPGRSGTGKSTLVTALVRHGAEYYSDEFAPIDPAGLVHAYARTPSPGGELAPLGGGGSDPRPPLPVGVILSTAFRAGVQWRPRIVAGTRGLLPILDNVIVCRNRPASALAAAKAIAGAVTLAGSRPDADLVAKEILGRVDRILGHA